jgi:hypothetical protein
MIFWQPFCEKIVPSSFVTITIKWERMWETKMIINVCVCLSLVQINYTNIISQLLIILLNFSITNQNSSLLRNGIWFTDCRLIRTPLCLIILLNFLITNQNSLRNVMLFQFFSCTTRMYIPFYFLFIYFFYLFFLSCSLVARNFILRWINGMTGFESWSPAYIIQCSINWAKLMGHT